MANIKTKRSAESAARPPKKVSLLTAPSSSRRHSKTVLAKTLKKEKDGARQRILVADDNNEILQVVRLLLEPKGYEVMTSKKNVLARVRSEHPNLLLLDVLMSGEDGRVITKKIKASQELRDVPVVLFSAKQNLAQIAADAGADGFLEKPFESRSLFRMVERHARSLKSAGRGKPG